MRNALVAGGLLVLLALVAVGSRGGGDRPAGTGGGAPPELTDALYTLAIVAVVGGVLAYFLLRFGAARAGVRSGRSSLIQLLALWTVMIVIALVFYRTYEGPNPFAQLADAFGRGIRGPGFEPGETEAVGEMRKPVFQWWLAALAIVAVAALAVLALRAVRPERRPPTAAEEVEALLDDVLEELEFDADPRRAVIQAYVRMERVLAAHGHARLAHEAPLEYLARVLRELNVRAESAHALTELFERASFSLHEIDAAMKSEAISSLAAVRDDLRAAA